MTLGNKYKTIAGNVVSVTAASVVNYFIKEIFEPGSQTVILCACETEDGKTEYWLSNQLKEVAE
ncbi:hypothetical protein [Enterococcus gilvus]|uniref:hypothetical protein n=1 Tax=Enterococcus gilvus TaxID=160453 RepID=UPI001C8C18F4|nr:hypothetical protein [Enterococcus gilvus]MBX8939227.1 hypothetical protein [Enterococcus gilvus]